MEQPSNSPENSRPDVAEPSSGAEDRASASEHKEDERLDSEALIDAANRGELVRVKEILQSMKTNGVDINHQDSDGDTALVRACSEGFTEVALELLKVDGIDVNIQDILGWTAYMRACSKGLTEVALELLKVDGLDVDLQDSYGWTALMWACSRGLTEVALELLKVDGIDVNLQDRGGKTALMMACYTGHADTALSLLRDPRVDRHMKIRDGSNALTWARNKGLTAVLTRFEALNRGDERMPLVKVHHRYLHGDVTAEAAQAEAPHPPESAITKALVDKNLMHYISCFLAQ
jgi:ankyrin repeat protein